MASSRAPLFTLTPPLTQTHSLTHSVSLFLSLSHTLPLACQEENGAFLDALTQRVLALSALISQHTHALPKYDHTIHSTTRCHIVPVKHDTVDQSDRAHAIALPSMPPIASLPGRSLFLALVRAPCQACPVGVLWVCGCAMTPLYLCLVCGAVCVCACVTIAQVRREARTHRGGGDAHPGRAREHSSKGARGSGGSEGSRAAGGVETGRALVVVRRGHAARVWVTV